jgi:hypothetical protein
MCAVALFLVIFLSSRDADLTGVCSTKRKQQRSFENPERKFLCWHVIRVDVFESYFYFYDFVCRCQMKTGQARTEHPNFPLPLKHQQTYAYAARLIYH